MARTRETPLRVWRAFPWDPDASAGEPFSPQWVPQAQGQGRFDLSASPGGVVYLAESSEHAVAEMTQHYRGQTLDEADLRIAGHSLALVSAAIDAALAARIVDLCDPSVLKRLKIRPDHTASSNRKSTQRIADELYAAGHAGLRWWSALTGDWHTIVLFRERIGRSVRFGEPDVLSLSHAAVIEASRALGIARRSMRR